MRQSQAALTDPATAIELVEPSLGQVPGYVAALETGWSPSAIRVRIPVILNGQSGPS